MSYERIILACLFLAACEADESTTEPPMTEESGLIAGPLDFPPVQVIDPAIDFPTATVITPDGSMAPAPWAPPGPEGIVITCLDPVGEVQLFSEPRLAHDVCVAELDGTALAGIAGLRAQVVNGDVEIELDGGELAIYGENMQAASDVVIRFDWMDEDQRRVTRWAFPGAATE